MSKHGRLKSDHHARDLVGVTARGHVQEFVQIGEIQLLKEGRGHAVVIMLAGVKQGLLEQLRKASHLCHDRGDFHKVGPHYVHHSHSLMAPLAMDFLPDGPPHCPATG